MNNYNFITFEGIEGCGKSTQVKKLQQYFIDNNIDFVTTREPGGVSFSEQIRNILLSSSNNSISAKTELLLNFASRIEHIDKKIKPALKLNKKVICDRFFDSTFAYQGYAMGLDLSQIELIKKISIGDFAPDITFLIDLPIETACERIKNRSNNNRYDEMSFSFHEKVRQGFLDLANNNSRIFIIDGLQNIDDISNKIIQKLID